MSHFLRSSLVVLAVFAMAAHVQAAGKGRTQAHKAPAHVSHTKAVAKGHKTAPRHAGKAPRQVSHSKVSHHRRPAVHRRPAQRVRRSTPGVIRQPVRRTVVRTVNRYPVHRVQRRILVRPNTQVRHSGRRRYTYSYYPGRYQWRTNHYNRRIGGSRRRSSRAIGGIVESVQGNPANGTLVVKTIRPRSSRFRFATARAGAARRGTSLHRFALNNTTRYEVLTVPRRGGTIADLHKGEHVLVLTHPRTAHQAQKIQVSPLRKKR